MVNDKRPVIQTQGYNGSEPTRICPHCGKEKPLSDLVTEIWGMILSVTSHGVRTVDKSNAPRHERGALLFLVIGYLFSV